MTSSLAAPAPLSDEQSALVCVTLDFSVDADANECKNTVCGACALFTERRRQITRLRIHASLIPEFGIFTVRQNGEKGPIFVTEDARETLENTGIVGVGFPTTTQRHGRIDSGA